MSKHNLTTEEAAGLPGPIFYTPREISHMVKLEYERVLQAIKDGEIPAQIFGRLYRVPAWWVNQHLTGAAEAEDVVDLGKRRSA